MTTRRELERLARQAEARARAGAGVPNLDADRDVYAETVAALGYDPLAGRE